MTLQRLYNIAQTGQTAEPTAVDNIMAQYQPKQEGGFWNGLKNFAGSNLGRMTLGGLTGAAIGGLTGRNVNEALLGGIAGATGAAKGITSRNQYFNNLAEKRQERADRMAEAEKSRQHALTMQANNIQANKDAADLEFERRMEAIREGRDYAEQQKANDKQLKIDAINSNPYLSDEQKAWQISQIDIPEFNNDAYYGSMLVRDPNNQDALNYFTNKAKLNSIINPEKLSFTDATKGVSNLSSATNLPADTKNAIAAGYGLKTNFIDTPKKYASGQLGLVQARMDETGEDFATASYNVGIMSPEEKQVLELKKMEREKELDNEYKLGFELFKSELPTQAHREALDEAEARGVPVNVIYQEKYDMAQADLAYKKSQTAKNEALTEGQQIANQVAPTKNQAEINNTNARTAKTRAEIPFVGMTPQMQNYGFIQQHPDAANSPVFKGSTTNINIGESKEVQKQYVKDVDEYKNMVSKLPQLNKTVAKLKELAPKATYTYIGQGVDFLGKQLVGKTTEGAEARAEYSAIVNNQILPLLRDTFGAQFTEREGAELRKTLGDLNASPDEKIAILEAFIAQKYADVESKRRKIEEYGYDTSNLPVVPQSVQSVGGFTIERVE